MRVPGAARQYTLRGNPAIKISRRQYDQHYGAATAFGTYEKKAKFKSREREAILRPARGRKSALKLAPIEKEQEIQRRKIAQQESRTLKRVQTERQKQHRYPTKIDLRNFKHGRKYRTIELPVSYEAIENTRAAAEKSGLVFGYYVGANLISERDGERISIAQFGLRHIAMKYKLKDFDDLMSKVQEKSYANLISLWIHLTLKADVATKRNGWRNPHVAR
jgi:hypothetical protein